MQGDPTIPTSMESLTADAAGCLMLKERTLQAVGLGGEVLEIYSLSGQKLLSASLASDNETVALHDLEPGFYVVSAGGCRMKMRLP